MRVAADEEGTRDAVVVAVVADGLGDGADMRLVERAAKRGSAVSAAAKDDPLRAIADVGRPGVVRRAKHLGIDERVRRGRLPHKRIHTHVITVTRNAPSAWRCSGSASTAPERAWAGSEGRSGTTA